MSTLDEFIEQTERVLQLPAGSLPPELRNDLLDLTRDVAHGVTRIAGPLSTYLLGLAVGAGADRATSVTAVAELAGGWDATDEAGAEGKGAS
jgi:hypothetical protein